MYHNEIQWISGSIRATITKDHELSSSKATELFTILEAGDSKVKILAASMSGGSSLPHS